MHLFLIIIFIHECFADKMSVRIFGGIDANPEEYPYVVRIEMQISHNLTNNTIIAHHRSICTASALSSVWLLTAAHCLTTPIKVITQTGNTYKMVIRYGHVENSPWKKDSFGEILHKIMHPLYMLIGDRGSVRTSRNDIGLLKTSPINICCYMKISAVDYQTMYGHEVLIGGFGLMTKEDIEGKVEINSTLNFKKPLQLLKVLLSKCSCRPTLLPALCLASRCSAVTNACPGDSGGPVIHPSGLIGVIALGEANCQKRNKRVYRVASITPVSPYVEWIYSHVNTFSSCDYCKQLSTYGHMYDAFSLQFLEHLVFRVNGLTATFT